jgi:hypothetical protein
VAAGRLTIAADLSGWAVTEVRGSDLLGVLRKRFVIGCNSTSSVSIKAMVFQGKK